MKNEPESYGYWGCRQSKSERSHEKYRHLIPGDLRLGAVVTSATSSGNTFSGQLLDPGCHPIAKVYVTEDPRRRWW